ncbi:MAG: DNA adenine methylase [Serratia proteamaculans]
MGYLGSKAASGVYQKIIANMPPHDTYIETHLGGGTIMLRKPLAKTNIGVDIDPDVLCEFNEGHRLSFFQVFLCDAIRFLERFDFTTAGRVLIYADPPYLPETRTSNARYNHEYTVEDHRRLIACLRSLPASVMLSGYPSALYNELLPDWRSITFQAMTRGGVRTEQLWMNFPEGQPFCTTYAGKDYIDRQRIKRKVERWRKKYQALPPAERLAIMQALLSIDG